MLPTGVMRSTNNAQTFSPYDPSEAIGDTAPGAPTQPKPKKNSCGAMGQMLLVIIAVVVVATLAPGLAGGFGSALNGGTFSAGFSAGMGAGSLTTAAALGAKVGAVSAGHMITGGTVLAGAIAGGAAAGAAGSIVSQGVGVAAGIQEKFSWNQVALAAIGGGVGGAFGRATSSFGAMRNGAIRSMLTQGLGQAMGLQDEFSWAGVAAAAVGGWIDTSIGNPIAAGAANAIANAATRTLIEGTDFGDNLIAALPDVVGSTIGNAIAGRISSEVEGARAARVERRLTAALDALEPQGDGADFPTTREVLRLRQETDRARDSETVLQRILRVITGRGTRLSAFGLALGLLKGDSGPPVIQSVVLEENRYYRLRNFVGSGSENWLVDYWAKGEYQPVGVAAQTSDGIFVIDDPEAISTYTGAELSNTIVASGDADSQRRRTGFGVEIRSQEEADLVESLKAQRATSNDINTQLSLLRLNRGEVGVRGGNLERAVRRYADLVASNVNWSWEADFDDRFTTIEHGAIRRTAIERGWVARVPYKPGTQYLDFESAGLIQRVDFLPDSLWRADPDVQRAWLNKRMPRGQPTGTVWHHSDIPGRMELVPKGIHNIYQHHGGRSPGNWAEEQ